MLRSLAPALLLVPACAHHRPTAAGDPATADQPLKVDRVSDEYSFARGQQCADGSHYKVTGQSLMKSESGCFVDRLEVRCEGSTSVKDRDAFYFAVCEKL